MKLNLGGAAKLLGILLSISILVSCNKVSSGSTKTPEQLKADLLKEIPGLDKIDAINKSPIDNMYEVVVGRRIFYVSNDGRYLLFGNLVDAVSKKNLTEERSTALSKIDWNQLPLDLAIKEVNGTGERKLAVFSDPECPYCQLFERNTVPNLTNTTVYTFLFPIPSHRNSKAYANAIWCSKDRASTWINWMRNKTPIPLIGNDGCDTSALDKVYKIGTDLVQVEGTPTLILTDGQILSGALPAEQLINEIDKAAGVKNK